MMIRNQTNNLFDVIEALYLSLMLFSSTHSSAAGDFLGNIPSIMSQEKDEESYPFHVKKAFDEGLLKTRPRRWKCLFWRSCLLLC